MVCDKCKQGFQCGEDVYVLQLKRAEFDSDEDAIINAEQVVSELNLCDNCAEPYFMSLDQEVDQEA